MNDETKYKTKMINALKEAKKGPVGDTTPNPKKMPKPCKMKKYKEDKDVED